MSVFSDNNFHVHIQIQATANQKILVYRHIAEHLDVPMDTSKMTEEELQFHYFKMHDSDNNGKLDGLELIKSLIHWHGTYILYFNHTVSSLRCNIYYQHLVIQLSFHHFILCLVFYLLLIAAEGNKDPNQQQKIFTDDELIALVDPILDLDDTDHDGYIDYAEFIRAQKRSAVPPPTTTVHQ